MTVTCTLTGWLPVWIGTDGPQCVAGGERRVVGTGTLVLVVGDLDDPGDVGVTGLGELTGGEARVVAWRECEPRAGATSHS